MNIFSRVKNAVVGMLGGALKRQSEKPTVHERRNGKLDFHAPPRMFRLRTSSSGPVKGPAFLPPTEGHHVSRQTCRAALRAIQFHHVSTLEGTRRMSRKDRRRLARLFACLEYRRMMQDDTNAIPADEAALYRHMTKLQLEGAA